MDIARRVEDGDLVEAEELWDLVLVDKNAYICRGCAAPVFPASFDKAINKRRPYFSLGRNNPHQAGCDVDGEEKIVTRGLKERVGSADGFPMPFPSKLSLSDERPVRSGAGAQTADAARAPLASASTAPSARTRRQHHGHTVKTIRPACRTFINFPNDREFLPFEIPGVWGDTYGKIFWFLPNKRPEAFKNPRHLFYAPIRWKAEPVVSEQHCELTLNAGEWNDASRTYTSLCRVRVDWGLWSQSRRDALMREFGATRTEAIGQLNKDSQIKGWIFFVGTQDPHDASMFVVDDFRFICCLAAKLSWPERTPDVRHESRAAPR